MLNNKILLINLAILAVYMLGLTAAHGASVLITSVIPICIQVFINLLLFIFSNDENKINSRTYLLSMFLVLLIGFSSCLGLSSATGGRVF